MPVFYSPQGNPEIWESKPHGYLTEEEWFTANPLPEPEPEPEPTLEEIAASYEAAIDRRLERFAQQLYSKGYANAVTYINSSVPEYRLEAEYLVRLRDETWQAAYAYMNELMSLVAGGEREVPSLEEVFAVLPVPAWPEGSRGYNNLTLEDN